MNKLIIIFFALILVQLTGMQAHAHPMGNFSINHYSRIEPSGKEINIRYLLDFAEIPTVTLKEDEDKNSDGTISDVEKSDYLLSQTPKILSNLSLAINGMPVVIHLKDSKQEFRAGAGGLQTTKLILNLTAPIQITSSGSAEIKFQDSNYAERTGWKEIVIVPAKSLKLTQNTASTEDRSHELTLYPTDPGIAPPQQTEALMTVTQNGGAFTGSESPEKPMKSVAPSNSAQSATPQDAFTQSISTKELSLGVILISLGLAFVFGAFHALAPGHGKAMVAAYLVGSRGTVKHALFLGGVVTITHTIGVFLLGILTLAAARYVVPEKFYPLLSGLSGVSIVIVGASLFWQRLKSVLKADRHHEHAHSDEHTHDHSHDHDHSHSHDHDHAHSHDGGHDHGDGHHHHHMPDNAEVSLKSLLVLGITGGALPCPSALVVMLSAIALHRIAFGLALISAFSLGLAAVLVAIGIMVVKLKSHIEKLPLEGKLIARLPLVSAALVTIVGMILVFRSITGKY